jgi:AcrR family transcriptional regulator
VRLDRQSILEQAFAALNEVGLERLTLRRLAARLDVQAPAIYWHFRNKQDLLDEMATQVMRELTEQLPVYDAARGWQDWCFQFGSGLRRTLLNYRDGARMFSGTYLTDASLYEAMEANLRTLVSNGFSLRQAVVALTSIYSYTVGFVIEEQAREQWSGEANPQYDLEKRNARIDKEKFPLAHGAGREMFLGYDARFVEGLGLIVGGMSAELASGGAWFDESRSTGDNR